MEEKPKIKPELSTAGRFIEMFGWFAVILLCVLTVINYSKLPDTVPTHFNAAGQPDDFGGKGSILILPVVAALLFAGLTILNKFPHVFNYSIKITPENALRQYTNATQMLRFLKLALVVVFSLLTYLTVQTAKGNSEGLGLWFLPFSLGLVFIPLIYFIIKSFRLK